ncbi:uncharacterized protein BCR38DRAFT_301622, partial [Pseudomassariella vexata]
FESLQSHSNSMRRPRPPDINTAGDENRVSLRTDSQPEALVKRESRVGLRSIFGRSRAGKDGNHPKESDDPSSLRELSTRPGGIRASLAEIGNWPHTLHPPRSESAFLPLTHTTASSRSTSATPKAQSSSARLGHPSHPRTKTPPEATIKTPRTARSANAPWDPPPLFQVYPQAIKHSTLSACNASIDVLIRMSGNRGSLLMHDNTTPAASNMDEEDDAERKGEKSSRRRHQRGGSRNILDWTSKIYVFVTSGYLLQYAAEGSFDRLPEKILQLSKDSAAFASDLIPGRHWVLQVSSYMDSDGTTSSDSKSLFAKLALRGPEKRHASNMLMVFQSAEDMDSWLAILRRGIEALGGKKKLTETGKPNMEDIVSPLRARPSQRILVVRDPERFTSVKHEDFSWTSPTALKEPTETLPALTPTEPALEFVLDDASTTESHYSSDGQRLDSLRDSGNWLSFISSGQRTVMTSAGSSPACSPVRPSFSRHSDDPLPQTSVPEVRLRPNAQAIANRRQSMQTMMPAFDGRIDPTIRPRSTAPSSTVQKDGYQFAPGRSSIPNFSVPHNTSRRMSGVRTTPLDSVSDQFQEPEQELTVKTTRKPPPTALAMSRPLSVVVDQPSPLCSPLETRGPTTLRPPSPPAEEGPASPSMFSAWVKDVAISATRGEVLPTRGSSLAAVRQSVPTLRLNIQTSPPRRSSVGALKEMSPKRSRSNAPSFILPGALPPPRAKFLSKLEVREETLRSLSSVDSPGPERQLPTTTSYKRGSFLAENLPSLSARHSFTNVGDLGTTDGKFPSLPRRSSKRLTKSPCTATSPQFLTNDPTTKHLLNRRSMPQLGDVPPPPLPPPTCALPPIPKK